MVDGEPKVRHKSWGRLLWVALLVGSAAAFAALVVMRMPRPGAVEPPQHDIANQPIANQLDLDQPLLPLLAAETVVETVTNQPEATPPFAPDPELESVPHFDARRFSAEFTLEQGAGIWPELFAPGATVQPFATAALADDFPELTAAEWQRWLEPVENETAEVSWEIRSGANVSHLQGLLQLRCPWPRDGGLHFTPLESRILTLLFWNGTQGAAIVYHPQAICDWAAYRLERAADARRPRFIALAAINGGTLPSSADLGVDVHYQAGQLIVSRGGIQLLAAPLAGRPQAVYVVGDAWFRTFGMHRRNGLPEISPAGAASGLTIERPAERPAGLDAFALPDDDSGREEFMSRLERLALQSADRGDSRAFMQWSEIRFTFPAWQNKPLAASSVPLAMAEVVPLVDADRNDEVARVCQKLRFWSQPSDPAEPWPGDRLGFKQLIEWAGARGRANRSLSRTDSDTAPSVSTPSVSTQTRHPWIVNQSRDALSPSIGLAAAVAEGVIDDACKLITETPLPSDAGLVADASDSHLDVDWEHAIRNALHDEPRLAAAMQTQFGRLGELRLSRAAASGDPDAVRAVSVQFLGTPIVAAAHLELGDRDLALGRFAQALARFQAGRRDASPDQTENLAQRLRLAASMIGMHAVPPARVSLQLNDRNLTPEQFEALVAKQRRRGAAGKMLPSDQLAVGAATGPPPGDYALRPIVSFPVSTASPTAKESEPAFHEGQALVTGTADGLLYITGSMGTAAVATQELQIRWSHPRINNRFSGPTPQRFASAGDRLFGSRPVAKDSELTCLDAMTGTVKWQKARAELPLISNPIWSQRQLFACAARPAIDGKLQLTLCEFNPETGGVSFEATIGELDGSVIASDMSPPICDLAAIDDRLVLAAAGGVACCDRAGHVHWLQRSTYLPGAIRGLATGTNVEMAIVVQPKTPLIVLQPGAPGLQAFDLDTGRRAWQRAIPDLHRIVSYGGGQIVALTPRGLLAFLAVDGAFAWQREIAETPVAWAVDGAGQTIAASVKGDENGRQQLVLRWLAAHDGHDVRLSSIDIPGPPLNSVAGLGVIAGRYFVVGSGQDAASGHLFELTPSATDSAELKP